MQVKPIKFLSLSSQVKIVTLPIDSVVIFPVYFNGDIFFTATIHGPSWGTNCNQNCVLLNMFHVCWIPDLWLFLQCVFMCFCLLTVVQFLRFRINVVFPHKKQRSVSRWSNRWESVSTTLCTLKFNLWFYSKFPVLGTANFVFLFP